MLGTYSMRVHASLRTIVTFMLLMLVVSSLVLTQRTFAATRGFVTSPELNVRAGPGKNYAIVDTLRQGTTVLIHTSNAAGDWLNISYSKNGARSGWVSAKHVRQGVQQPLLTVVNLSDETVYLLYVAPSSESEWGSDVLGRNTTLAPGESFDLRLAPNTYDILAKNYDLETIAVDYNVSVFADTTWYIE
jgi:uncharacterized protein YraI